MDLARASLFAVLLALVGAVLPAGLPAQELGRIVSPILTIDRDRLFSETLFGKRVNAELQTASDSMKAETRQIESGLETEEKALTEKRSTMSAEDFRKLADAFDKKVQSLRADRETAKANLQKQIDAAQAQFYDQIGPILGALVRERGAVMILDKRAILLTAADVDITDAAIARIDAVLGEGEVTDPAGATAPGSTTGAALPSVEGIPALNGSSPDSTTDSTGQ